MFRSMSTASTSSTPMSRPSSPLDARLRRGRRLPPLVVERLAVGVAAKLLPWAASEGPTTPLTQARICRLLASTCAVDGAAESGAPDVSLHVDRVHVLYADEQTVQSTRRPFAAAPPRPRPRRSTSTGTTSSSTSNESHVQFHVDRVRRGWRGRVGHGRLLVR